MSRAQAILNKIDAGLRKFGPPPRLVYKRVTVATGDSLIGRVTTTITDTILSPQPMFTRTGRETVKGGGRSETMADSSDKLVIADDYEMFISPTAMTEADIQNTSLVLKDILSNEEVLRMLDYSLNSVEGTVVSFTVYYRSVKRP